MANYQDVHEFESLLTQATRPYVRSYLEHHIKHLKEQIEITLKANEALLKSP
jgi:hypothetical protein